MRARPSSRRFLLPWLAPALVGCGAAEASRAAPRPVAPMPSAPQTRSDRAVCDALLQKGTLSSTRWRDAFRRVELGGYVFVIDAEPPSDDRVIAAIDALGAREVQVARCEGALVVWLPATNLELAAEIEDFIVTKPGARTRESIVVPRAAE